MNETSGYNEKGLLLQMAAGKEEAFAAFYHQYHPAVTLFMQKFLKSPQLAEDLCQEVFVKIWESRAKLAEVQSFRAYLFVVARNHTLTALRTISRHETAIGEIVRHYTLPSSTTDDVVLTQEYMRFLHSILESLPPRTREIFRLCREQGKTYEEVAALLGISRNAVKNHMVQAMKVLRSAVEKDLGISLPLFFAILIHSS